jgi:hypothetical protein
LPLLRGGRCGSERKSRNEYRREPYLAHVPLRPDTWSQHSTRALAGAAVFAIVWKNVAAAKILQAEKGSGPASERSVFSERDLPIAPVNKFSANNAFCKLAERKLMQ